MKYQKALGDPATKSGSAVRNLMTQATNIKNAESVIRDGE